MSEFSDDKEFSYVGYCCGLGCGIVAGVENEVALSMLGEGGGVSFLEKNLGHGW